MSASLAPPAQTAHGANDSVDLCEENHRSDGAVCSAHLNWKAGSGKLAAKNTLLAMAGSNRSHLVWSHHSGGDLGIVS